MKFLNCNSATRISPPRPPISATILFTVMMILSISANTAGAIDISDLAAIPPNDIEEKAGTNRINDTIMPKIAKSHKSSKSAKRSKKTPTTKSTKRTLPPNYSKSEKSSKSTKNPPAEFKKTQILVVVDMENAYCSPGTCGEWYSPGDDGPGYSFTPRNWLGPGCGHSCKSDEDCWDKADLDKPIDTRAPGFDESVQTMTCQHLNQTEDHGFCACDSVPSEKDVISYITKVIGTTNNTDHSSYWDHIIFTHDWLNYGHVCSVGQLGNDPDVKTGNLTIDECWQQSAQHSTTCGNNTKSGCTSSLVAWSKGAEIVKPLQDAVNKAFANGNGMQDTRVHHVVKKHANWGLARHQPMNNVTEAQGKRTPYYLLEDLNIVPEHTRLTVTGSFTQYCVIAGMFQMILSGFDDIAIAEAATGGFMDSYATKLCEEGKKKDEKGNPCPIPPPSKPFTFAEWSAWMALTGQGEDNFPLALNSVNTVATTKANALSWMDEIGVTVKKSPNGEPLEEGWKEYKHWMNNQGGSIPKCFIEGWC